MVLNILKLSLFVCLNVWGGLVETILIKGHILADLLEEAT